MDRVVAFLNGLVHRIGHDLNPLARAGARAVKRYIRRDPLPEGAPAYSAGGGYDATACSQNPNRCCRNVVDRFRFASGPAIWHGSEEQDRPLDDRVRGNCTGPVRPRLGRSQRLADTVSHSRCGHLDGVTREMR